MTEQFLCASTMPSVLRALGGRDILHNLVRTAFDAVLDALDDLHILALPVCLLERGVREPLEDQRLGPDIYVAAMHTDPDKVLLRALQAFLADEDVETRRRLRMERRHLLSAHMAEPLAVQIIFHSLPPRATRIRKRNLL